MNAKHLTGALLFSLFVAASSLGQGNFSASSTSSHHEVDYIVNESASLHELDTKFQSGSFAAWIEENIWDHTFAADVVVFRLPLPHETDNKDRRLQVEERDNSVPHSGEDLVVTVTFRDIYKTIFFVFIAWFLGALSVYIGLPSLVGEIFAGFLLGPPLADFVPYPGALVLAGNIGLIGLILESGIGLDVAQLKEVGSRALIMAIVGSCLPLLVGYGVGQWMGSDMKPAIALGAAFAPSSLGVASVALSTGEVLNTPIGQLIVASSVFDDVFGLILLSIIEVFADPSPSAFDYVLPFLASFGYLIVLGYLGITQLPKLIEKRVLPLVSEPNRDQLAMVLMMLLMIAYMLALNYSGSSYLTGVFLAGMTFSQIHSVHASFVTHGRPLLEWLLRIFFSATIGFQVPVTKFGDPYVVKWGFALLLPVFAKVPLGFLVPHFQTEIPTDFPYNPFYRDVIVTSLSVTCRGEFNFIVASYALSEGLFGPDVYSAVIFAVLFGSIVCPLVLSKVLRYYNEKSLQFLDGDHPVERIGNTCDGNRPLFLAIQARTPVLYKLQEEFEKTLASIGLLIIDHRSWHTLGRGSEAVDITELFVQDTKVKVRVKGCFPALTRRVKDESIMQKSIDSDADMSAILESTSTAETPESTSNLEEGLVDEEEVIKARCKEIEDALAECLGSDNQQNYAIQVSQWQAFVAAERGASDEPKVSGNAHPRKRFYSFQSNEDDIKKDNHDSPDLTSEIESSAGDDQNLRHRRTASFRFHSFHSNEDDIKKYNQDNHDSPDLTSEVESSAGGDQNTGHQRTASFRRPSSPFASLRRSNSHLSNHSELPQLYEDPCLSTPDLWELDNACHDATRRGYTQAYDCQGNGMHSVAQGTGRDIHAAPPIPPRRGHSRAVSFDAALLTSHVDMETFVIRDRLHGYVRHHQLPAHPED